MVGIFHRAIGLKHFTMANLPVISKRPTTCKNLRAYFKEYCISSSIHGIRYFGERRSYFERGWWLMVFLSCLSCCAYTIWLVYQRWEQSPVILSFSTREKLIPEIPFPAVTICPETKALKSSYSYSDMLLKLLNKDDLTEEEFIHSSYMNVLCDLKMSRPLNTILNKPLTFNNTFYSDKDFFDFMSNVTPNIFNIISDCKWMDELYDCDTLFDLVLTDEGICATFNMLDKSSIYKDFVYFHDIPFAPNNSRPNVTWSLGKGYEQNEGLDTFPRRALAAGAKNSLSFRMKELNENLDHACKIAKQGFKVTLHTPSKVPRPRDHYVRLPLNSEVISAVQPVMVTTLESVAFKPKTRECFFENEKPLKYFRVYDQKNCQLECLTDFTLKWCGCVNFFMPKKKGTPICGLLRSMCMDEAERVLQQGQLSNLLGIIFDRNTVSSTYSVAEVPYCDCLPCCTDLNYEAETSESAWDWKKLELATFPKHSESSSSNVSRSSMIIYFKNNQFVTSKRHELYGPTDFLGNFGGLLGLFTGFSILSLMEIIYFLTVRIICNITMYGKWSGRENGVI